MGQLKIFENEEFGQIRTVMRDGEVWFVGKDVAEILGYVDPNKAIAMHVDEEDKLNDKMASSLGQRGGWLINESGLYGLILSSKLPSARKFKHWVTSEVLPAIRKTGIYDMDEYSPEMKAILMHDKKLVKIDNRVTDLENHMTIDYGQQTVLGDEVNKAVLDALGGKYSNTYNEIGKKVFAECNRDLKHYFHINARNNVPKRRFEEAVQYIQRWTPCTNTQIQIRDCNAQVCMP
ncbi:BRO family protein [Hominisplanchenecus sp.]|uniref:BRO family protein n=1 Tax=Hominisplanchenecus sp. TaxID=3038130 RepID=UPI0039961CE9